jgi:N-acetyl-anhydromuramyl-L-alanine amidase AmpD
MSNTSIVICGQKYDIGTRVVLWDESGGFNAYEENTVVTSVQNRKTGKMVKQTISGKRYGSRSLLTPNPSLPQLQKTVTQFFLHHTGVVDAKTTFEVLHNERKLSVTFILDDSGCLYECLDVKEKSWHGGTNNPMSVGIEICSKAAANKFPDSYDEYHQQKYHLLPRKKRMDYVQKEWILGYEYNDEQYKTLICLGKILCDIFPNIASNVNFPRASNGTVMESVISEPLKHRGFICHYNTSKDKIDPISFDHERFLLGVKNNNPDQPSSFMQFDSVESKQQALKDLGYDPGAIDGAWGPHSQQALKNFQKDNNITADGVWGDKVDVQMGAVLKSRR